jgi:type IV secretory pathway component VirB8
MDNQKVKELEEKIDKIYVSVEKTRKYFMWTMIITLVVLVLPVIGLAIALPSFMSNYVDQIQLLSQ